ncbi:RES family NAD+ phosphorylase [Neiella marina]|uniref:RES family NAD+ phosphorylase n=1 Tax=Neiella holothuriorum TaxID=2870530 RepID=A0ABS7ED80_9GAMM|nr:RES family NAD+ phosphorylase [Neiella holothuriorum]MBW8190285.1 RES family NAD+ phosphorylase [Neiella holothuriorum]
MIFPDIVHEPLNGTLWRIVESQESAATLSISDNLAEQAVLEELLEQHSKPPYRDDLSRYSYLLSTPFRYPPLDHGSRFGAATEPSLFYGSVEPNTALTECAYYRFSFWDDMVLPPPNPMVTQHSLFNVGYATEHGANLISATEEQRTLLSHPSDYSYSQSFGTHMRDAGIKLFQFYSARCSMQGMNIALFDPSPFTITSPTSKQEWLCELTEGTVFFKRVQHSASQMFLRQQFIVDGKLPRPA